MVLIHKPLGIFLLQSFNWGLTPIYPFQTFLLLLYQFIYRLYSNPQGARFVPNIAPIQGQGYVYHPPSGVHPGLHHTQNVPSSTLNPSVAAYTQPQPTIVSSPVYHPAAPPAPANIQPQYITPVESLHPMQTSGIAIKIEKASEEASGSLYPRTSHTAIPKDLNLHQDHVFPSAQQSAIVVQGTHLIRSSTAQDVDLSRQQNTKILVEQQPTQNQTIIPVSLPEEEILFASHLQKEQEDKEERQRREKESQRQKIIEDHQKQKNSNRIFSNSTKNLTDVAKYETNKLSSRRTSLSNPTSDGTMSTSPAEHGFRKISAPLGQSVPPKIRSPLPQAEVKVYKCIMCGFLAESASLLGRHAFEMHEKRSKKWRIGQKCPVRHECEECDYETPDIHRLHRHMQRVHDTDQVFHFQCKECDFVATSADLLGRHALEVHEAGSVFRCSLCDFTSNRKSDRDRHFTGAHQLDYDTYAMSSGGLPPSKQMYECLVSDCNERIRGDKLKDHYKKYVKFALLEEDGEGQQTKIQHLQRKEADHTQYFIQENFDTHSIPGYKRHTKAPFTASSSDPDSSFDNQSPRKRKKRRHARPAKRVRRNGEEMDQTDTEDEEEELKKELTELGIKQIPSNETISEQPESSIDEVEVDQDEQATNEPIKNDAVEKTIEKLLSKENEEQSTKTEVFPKKCNLCCDELNDKSAMINHIRNKHIVRSIKKPESSTPKFEIIRQKPSKCLNVIREETSNSH